MLSAGSFSSPYEHLSQPETKRMVEHYTAYLSDNTRLIANPGLKVSAGLGPVLAYPSTGLRGVSDCTFEVGSQLWICASQLESQRGRVCGPGEDGPSDGVRSPVGRDEESLPGLMCTKGFLGRGV